MEFYMRTAVIENKRDRYKISILQKVCNHKHLNPLAKSVIECIIDNLDYDAQMFEEIGI